MLSAFARRDGSGAAAAAAARAARAATSLSSGITTPVAGSVTNGPMASDGPPTSRAGSPAGAASCCAPVAGVPSTARVSGRPDRTVAPRVSKCASRRNAFSGRRVAPPLTATESAECGGWGDVPPAAAGADTSTAIATAAALSGTGTAAWCRCRRIASRSAESHGRACTLGTDGTGRVCQSATTAPPPSSSLSPPTGCAACRCAAGGAARPVA